MDNQLENIKIRLDIKGDSEDKLLEILIKEARLSILGYTGRTEDKWLDIFNSFLVKIVVYEYNLLGMEGIENRKEGGISTSFNMDYPSSILRPLNPYRLVRVVK